MPTYIILAALAAGLSIPLLFWAFAGARTNQAVAAQNLTRNMGSSSNLRELILSRPASERTVAPVMDALASAARRLSPQGLLDALDRRIVLAGRPEAWPLQRVLAAKIVLGLMGAFTGLIYIFNARSIATVVLAMFITVFAFFLPDLMLRIRGRNRQEKMMLALPDTLDQMTICVQAGLGFEAAMARAGQTGEGPLADEIIRTLQEMQIGATRAEALRGLIDRTQVPELRQFIVALLQAESYGLPISKVLNTQASDLRVRRRQRAEERAQKMPVKMAFPLVVCILPAMFIVALGPAVIRILRFLGGA